MAEESPLTAPLEAWPQLHPMLMMTMMQRRRQGGVEMRPLQQKLLHRELAVRRLTLAQMRLRLRLRLRLLAMSARASRARCP
jgi:hypothetical protein